MYFQGLPLFCCFDRNRKQIATCKFKKISKVDVHDIYLIFDRDMDIITIRLIKSMSVLVFPHVKGYM